MSCAGNLDSPALRRWSGRLVGLPRIGSCHAMSSPDEDWRSARRLGGVHNIWIGWPESDIANADMPTCPMR